MKTKLTSVCPSSLNVLVIDIGGTNGKVLATGQKERRGFPSGPKLTPQQMVVGVDKPVADELVANIQNDR